MFKNMIHWVRKHTIAVVNSIALYPALIAISFLLLSILMLEIDISSKGKELKLQSNWIRLRDADTARSIVSTITTGVISLTVFSFSMVMIVLNQAASYMSNRILQNLIGNRSQQLILGTYIGTIVYALFLLSSIRDIDTGTSIPTLSIFLLIILTVVDIFIFIYFLHYITQSIKYQTIIKRIENETMHALEKEGRKDPNLEIIVENYNAIEIVSNQSGFYQGSNKDIFLKQAEEHDFYIKINKRKGSFILKGTPFIIIYTNKKLNENQIVNLLENIDFYNDQPISRNPFFGFRQLTEVAIKALSPGINDPSTAVLSLQSIIKLLAYRLQYPPKEVFKDKKDNARLFQKDYAFDELFYQCLQPIWNYGKEDQYIQDTFYDLLRQLMSLTNDKYDLSVIYSLFHQADVSRTNRIST